MPRGARSRASEAMPMSWDAVNWAMRFKIDPSARKFLLVVLANFADEHASCYPGQQYLAEATGQSERSVRGHLAVLEEQGYIRRVERWMRGGLRTSDRYFLQLDATPGPLIDRRPAGLDPDAQPPKTHPKGRRVRGENAAGDDGIPASSEPADSAGSADLGESGKTEPVDSAGGQICRSVAVDSAGYTSGVTQDDDDRLTPLSESVDNAALVAPPLVLLLADQLAATTGRSVSWNLTDRDLFALDTVIRRVEDVQPFIDLAVGQDASHVAKGGVPAVSARAYLKHWLRIYAGRAVRPPVEVVVPDKCDQCNPDRWIEDPETGNPLRRCTCHPGSVRQPAF